MAELIKQRKAEDIIGRSNYAKNLRAFLRDTPAHGFYVIGGPKSSGKKFVAEVLLSRYSEETGIKTHNTVDELLGGIESHLEEKTYGDDYRAIKDNLPTIIDRVLESPEPFLRLAEQRSFGFHETFKEFQKAVPEIERRGRLLVFIDEDHQYPYLHMVRGRSIGVKTKAIEERIEDSDDFADFFKKKQMEPAAEIKRAIREKINEEIYQGIRRREVKIAFVRELVQTIERFTSKSKVDPRVLAMVLEDRFLQKGQINLEVHPAFNEETAMIKIQKPDKIKQLEAPKNSESGGVKLRKIREELGMTQKELGEIAGLTNFEISRAETDKSLSGEKWAKIIAALKTHPKITQDEIMALEETLGRD